MEEGEGTQRSQPQQQLEQWNTQAGTCSQKAICPLSRVTWLQSSTGCKNWAAWLSHPSAGLWLLNTLHPVGAQPVPASFPALFMPCFKLCSHLKYQYLTFAYPATCLDSLVPDLQAYLTVTVNMDITLECNSDSLLLTTLEQSQPLIWIPSRLRYLVNPALLKTAYTPIFTSMGFKLTTCGLHTVLLQSTLSLKH